MLELSSDIYCVCCYSFFYSYFHIISCFLILAIGELQEGLKKKEHIDLANAFITLDIICLTLSNEPLYSYAMTDQEDRGDNSGDVKGTVVIADDPDQGKKELKMFGF